MVSSVYVELFFLSFVQVCFRSSTFVGLFRLKNPFPLSLGYS